VIAQIPHPQGPDPEFAPNERLYRALAPGAFDGNEVKVTALDNSFWPPRGLSCDRGRYADHPRCMTAGNSRQGWRVVFLTCRWVAEREFRFDVRVVKGKTEWRTVILVVEHLPILGNYAHTEVRARERDREYSPRFDPRGLRNTLRQEVAAAFCIISLDRQVEPLGPLPSAG